MWWFGGFQWWMGIPECQAGFPAPTHTVGKTLAGRFEKVLTMFSGCHGIVCPCIDLLGRFVVSWIEGSQESWNRFVFRLCVTQATVPSETPREDTALHIQCNLSKNKEHTLCYSVITSKQFCFLASR